MPPLAKSVVWSLFGTETSTWIDFYSNNLNEITIILLEKKESETVFCHEKKQHFFLNSSACLCAGHDLDHHYASRWPSTLRPSADTLLAITKLEAIFFGFAFMLTHLSLGKMAAISQTILSAALSWMKNFAFWSKFHWNLFLRVQLTIFHHWLR